MNYRFFLILFISFSVVTNSFGQEITRNDIIKEDPFHASKLSVFGIKLGLTRAEAKDIVSDNPALIWVEDKIHGTRDFRSYVYNTDESGKKNKAILYLLWKDGRAKLNRIVFFDDFQSYLIGESKALLSKEILLPGNPVSRDFLGIPDSTKVALDIPMIKMKHTAYYYGEKGIQIIQKFDNGKVSVIFAIAD